MPQIFLHHLHWHAFPQQLCGPVVAEIVRREGGIEAQGGNGRFHNPLHRSGRQPFAVGAAAVGDKQCRIAIAAFGQIGLAGANVQKGTVTSSNLPDLLTMFSGVAHRRKPHLLVQSLPLVHLWENGQ